MFMPISHAFSHNFDYILHSDYSLIPKYRKPVPLFEPSKHLFDFNDTGLFSSRSITLCPYNSDLSLLKRYRYALESCGYRVYTEFEEFEDIKVLLGQIHHNWHSVIKTMSDYRNNKSCSADLKYKAFIYKYAFALLIDAHDEQVLFFMPLTARMHIDSLYGGKSISDFYTMFVLVPKKRIEAFSSRDLYQEMLSVKFGSSMSYEYKNLKGYPRYKSAKCLADNLAIEYGINTFAMAPFNAPCTLNVDTALMDCNLRWLNNGVGHVFNSFIEMQSFIFKHLGHDFIYLANDRYENTSLSSYAEPFALLSWYADGLTHILKIVHKDNLLCIASYEQEKTTKLTYAHISKIFINMKNAC